MSEMFEKLVKEMNIKVRREDGQYTEESRVLAMFLNEQLEGEEE